MKKGFLLPPNGSSAAIMKAGFILIAVFFVCAASGCGKQKSDSSFSADQSTKAEEALPPLAQNQVPANPFAVAPEGNDVPAPEYESGDAGPTKDLPDEEVYFMRKPQL